VLARIKNKTGVGYFVLDGHFGNHCACWMVRQLDLHIISKMPHNAELYLQPTDQEKAQHPRLKYGARLDYAHLPEALRVSSTTEAGYCLEVYQAICLHKLFAPLLNIVIVVKTDLKTQRVGHVVLLSSDLSLAAALVVDYYVLRFQIEFTFRDAKQYFGLEDFMVIDQTPVANAVGLSFFLVNLSRPLLPDLRTAYPGAGITDLKSYYRARHYVVEFLKLVPEQAEGIVCASLIAPICRRLFIHPPQNSADDLKRAA
jgi:putative transposase